MGSTSAKLCTIRVLLFYAMVSAFVGFASDLRLATITEFLKTPLLKQRARAIVIYSAV